MKRCILFCILSLVALVSLFPCTADAATLSYGLGDKIQDFTFTTYQGEQYSLYEILEEKEAVLINIWATWCGPCRNEFPYMQEAYAQYNDRVEVIALSSESTDTPSKLTSFAEQYGLSFKVGQDPVGFLAALGVNSIPTSMMIDRFGTICFIQSGSLPNTDAFIRLFDAFLGEDYTQSVLLTGIPARKPDIAAPDAQELASALGANDGSIAYRSSDGKYTWPMQIAEKDGRTVAVSSNSGIDDSRASVIAEFAAQQGDAISVTFKLSCESIWDAFQLSINGEVIKTFTGEEDWQTYAYSIPLSGSYVLETAYVKNSQQNSGDDMLWIDTIALLTGDDAQTALNANRSYPVADEAAIRILNSSARRLEIDDPTGMFATYYGDAAFYLVPEDRVTFVFDIPQDWDPEAAIVYFNFDSQILALADCLYEDGFTATGGIDSIQTTGYCDSSVVLYRDQYNVGKILTYLKTEADVDALVAALTSDASGNVQATWRYADEAEVQNDEEPQLSDEPVEYIIRCTDQHGNPVQSVMLQVCDDEICQVFTTDADGVCRFSSAPYAWEIHVLITPAGYTADSPDIVYAPVQGGEVSFTFTKCE